MPVKQECSLEFLVSRYNAFAAFFRVLNRVGPELLKHHPPAPKQFPGTFQPDPNTADKILTFPVGAEYHEYGSLAFLSNYGCNNTKYVENGLSECSSRSSRDVLYRGRRYHMPNRTVLVTNLTTGEVLFNTSDPLRVHARQAVRSSGNRAEAARVQPSRVEYHLETPGAGAHVARAGRPVEQLQLTLGDTDYLWYRTSVPASAVAAGCTMSAEVGKTASEYFVPNSILHAFAAGDADRNIPVNATADVGVLPTDGAESATAAHDDKTATLFVLSNGMGLTNVDPQPSDTKGLSGRVALICPTANGKIAVDITKQPWTMAWPLTGESQQIYMPASTEIVPWQPLDTLPPAARQVWFRFHVDLPAQLLGAAQATQTAFALDLSAMGKGMAFVNGFNIGRYWLILSGSLNSCKEDQCALNFPGPVCYFHKKDCGLPTQHLYHVPTELLKQRGNLVVLFEESNQLRASDARGVALVALHEHPGINSLKDE